MPFSLSHIRQLTVALIISGSLNIALLVFFFYWIFQDHTPTPYCELKPANKQEQQLPLAIDNSNSDLIRCFRKLSLEQLISRLKNTQLVENGYSQRDLALACLIDYHFFDIERALLGYAQPEQKRSLSYGKLRNGKIAELTVYPGLSEKQYEAIVAFSATERWPLTSRGLFLTLHKQKTEESIPSLSDAFFLTPEFLSVETLFGRAKIPVQKKELLDVLLEGDWELLSAFVKQQRISQDLSAARRQRFLLDYIQRNSQSAALLILKTDLIFAISKLDDNHVNKILQLLEKKSQEAEKFALSLLTSPRSDAVWKMAAARLYEYAGESIPDKHPHHAALSRFVPRHTILSMERKRTEVLSMEDKQPQIPPINHSVIPVCIKPASLAKVDNPRKIDSKSGSQASKDAPSPIKPVAPIKPPDKQPIIQSIPSKTGWPQAKNVRRERMYIVQEGDSLWKIARRFNVEVDLIKTRNKLESDFLKPGRPLLIP